MNRAKPAARRPTRPPRPATAPHAGASARGPKPDATAARTRLRTAGLRGTPARLAVLDALGRASEPQTHAQVAAAAEGLGADRATIYRNLLQLADAGLVRRRDLGDHVWRFELVSEGNAKDEAHHPHLVCTSCGGVSCLEDVQVDLRASRTRLAALRRDGLEIQLRGRCDGCA